MIGSTRAILLCPVVNQIRNILVVQPAQDGAAKNGPDQFDGARETGASFLQRQMASLSRCDIHVRQQYMNGGVARRTQQTWSRHFPSDRTDQAVSAISVLPWGARRCRPVHECPLIEVFRMKTSTIGPIPGHGSGSGEPVPNRMLP